MRKGKCGRCGKSGVWVNDRTRDDRYLGEFCADCFDLVGGDPPPRRAWSSGSGPNHADPGFDNVVRALEEDR